MIEINEFIALVFCLIGLVILISFLKKSLVPRNRYLVGAFCFILASNVFTVAEGFLFHTLFNLLEHASYAAAAGCTLAGVLSNLREGT